MADWTKSTWDIPFQQLKTLYLHYLNAYLTKHGREVTYHEGLPPKKSHDCLPASIITVTMATKLYRMVTYFDGLLYIKSNDRLIMLSWESHDKLLQYHSDYGHQTC